jgi:pimeloyl-ACP methyl ester carboxylesterase
VRLWTILICTAGLLAACSSAGPAAPSISATLSPALGRADIGGYSLAYECEGAGSPTVVLEAGYTASGIDAFGQVILPIVAKTTRVCTHDRAGDGESQPRPARVSPLTGRTQARELLALLNAIHVGPPY